MDAQTLLEHLRAMRETPDTLPDWPFSEATIQNLVKDPQASARYIDERLHKRFETRAEKGEHRQAYLSVSGFTPGRLTQLHQKLGLRTKRSTLSLQREQEALRVKEHKQKILDAVCDVIRGYGSPRTLEKTYELGFMVIYRHAKRELEVEGVDYRDLRVMPTPTRKALAERVYKRRSKEIEKEYATRIKGE